MESRAPGPGSHRPRRRPLRRAGVGFLLAAAACGTPEPSPETVAAIQLAAATDLVDDIAANPGPIQTICLGYAGDWEDPGLPTLAVGGPELAYMDGCVEVEGSLRARAGGGQAVSVSVGEPELKRWERAEVIVLTSSGARDLAAYSCTVRERDGVWRSEGCELGAIT